MMTRTTRLLVLGLAGAAFLLVAGQAFAAYGPQITASTIGARTVVRVVGGESDPASARLQILVPKGVTANLGSVGQTLGTAAARATAADLGGAALPLAGTIQARAATGTFSVSGTPVPLAAAATRCTGSATHSAFWVLTLSAAGQAIEVPIFVDAGPAGGPAYVLTLCLAAPDLPSNDPQRSPFGAKLFEATVTVNGVFTAPAGEKRWSLIGTPYAPGTGKPNPAGTVETQGLDRGPAHASLTARKLGKRRASVVAAFFTTGTPSPIGGAGVVILAGRRIVARGRTSSGGQFRGTVRLPAATAALTARITAPARNLGASACLATQPPIPCVGATLAGFTGTSNRVVVRT
jgi:hypothetical protein